MTAGSALLDTGPIVALLHRDDDDHLRCRQEIESFRGVLLTTEPVLTEATHLLSRIPGGQAASLEFFLRGAAVLVPMTLDSLKRCKDLMSKYHDTPMDLADATLVSLAEDTGVNQVFTLDRRGFSAYRIRGRTPFRIRPDRDR